MSCSGRRAKKEKKNARHEKKQSTERVMLSSSQIPSMNVA